MRTLYAADTAWEPAAISISLAGPGEIINRGGQNIDPVEGDRVLASHPAVAEGAVFAVPDSRLVEDVAAARRPGSGHFCHRPRLRVWMLDHLSLCKVPRQIRFADAFHAHGPERCSAAC